eukprot:jgi/Bigna1/86362/estExt_fgenesh1_pg.C_100033
MGEGERGAWGHNLGLQNKLSYLCTTSSNRVRLAVLLALLTIFLIKSDVNLSSRISESAPIDEVVQPIDEVFPKSISLDNKFQGSKIEHLTIDATAYVILSSRALTPQAMAMTALEGFNALGFRTHLFDDPDINLPHEAKISDVAIFVGEDVSSLFYFIRLLKQRGVITVWYQTGFQNDLAALKANQSMVPYRCIDYVGLSDIFHEVWDTGLGNVDTISACRNAPKARHLPVGFLNRSPRMHSPTKQSGSMPQLVLFGKEGLGASLSLCWQHLQQSTLLSRHLGVVDEGLNEHNFRSHIEGSEGGEDKIFLSIHNQCEVSANGKTARPSLKTGPLLSTGALLISERCHPKEEKLWEGIVDFVEVGRIEETYLKIARMSSEDRIMLSQKRLEMFKSRFSPLLLMKRANIVPELIRSETMKSESDHLRMIVMTLIEGLKSLGLRVRYFEKPLNPPEAERGDIFIWVGIYDDEFIIKDLKRRVHVGHSNQPLSFFIKQCSKADPWRMAHEVWSYGAGNVEEIKAIAECRGLPRTTRYVPAGYIAEWPRAPPFFEDGRNDTRLIFMGNDYSRWACLARMKEASKTFREKFSRVHNLWNAYEFSRYIEGGADAKNNKIFMSIHRPCPLEKDEQFQLQRYQDPTAPQWSLEPRASVVLNTKSFLISERCHPKDEESWKGIVDFVEQEKIINVYERLVGMGVSERQQLLDERWKLFRTRFNPAQIMQRAGVQELIDVAKNDRVKTETTTRNAFIVMEWSNYYLYKMIIETLVEGFRYLGYRFIPYIDRSTIRQAKAHDVAIWVGTRHFYHETMRKFKDAGVFTVLYQTEPVNSVSVDPRNPQLCPNTTLWEVATYDEIWDYGAGNAEALNHCPGLPKARHVPAGYVKQWHQIPPRKEKVPTRLLFLGLRGVNKGREECWRLLTERIKLQKHLLNLYEIWDEESFKNLVTDDSFEDIHLSIHQNCK